MGVGARVLRVLGLDNESVSVRACFALGIGLGVVAYGVLALGLMRLLALLPVGALLGLFVLLGARPAAALAKEGVSSVRERAFSGSCLPMASGGAVALMLLLAFIAAVAPPSAGDWDGLAYHLADPAIYIRQRGIVPLFWESHSNFPFTVEMLYTLALLLKSPEGARLFHWLFLVLTCLTLASTWTRLWPDAPPRARWLAPLLTASAPVVLWCATVAYIDLGLMAYSLLALYATWLWMCTDRAGWLWVSGLCLGWALGIKMTGGILALLLAPLVLLRILRVNKQEKRLTDPSGVPAKNRQTGTPGPSLRLFVVWGGIAAVVAAPWYIKSYVYTGNPVYPFFYHLFPNTRYWNAAIAATYAEHQAGFGMGHGLRHLLTVPWDLVAHPDRFGDGSAAFQILFESIGPAMLALAPVPLLLRRFDPLVWGMLCFTLAYLLVWFGLTQQTRYLMPIFPLLSLVGARGLCGLHPVWTTVREEKEQTRADVSARRAPHPRSGPRHTSGKGTPTAEKEMAAPASVSLPMARVVADGTVVVTTLLAIVLGVLLAKPGLPVVLGRESREAYLHRTLDLYPILEYANAVLPANARVMLIHETRGFYLQRDYLWGNEGHHAAIPWRQFASEQEMRRFLRRELGVTHVLVNHNVLGKEARPQRGNWEWPLWEAIRAGTLVPEYEARGFVLYALTGD